jgi:hypothetical protein
MFSSLVNIMVQSGPMCDTDIITIFKMATRKSTGTGSKCNFAKLRYRQDSNGNNNISEVEKH